MGRHDVFLSAMFALAILQLGHQTEAFCLRVPLRVPLHNEIRTNSGTAVESWTRPLHAGPVVRGGSRRRGRSTMDAGEDLERLDGIPGMPETIGFGHIDNTTATTGANLKDYAWNMLWPSANADPRGIHSILQTRGSFKLGEGATPIVLPEYSLDETTPQEAAGSTKATAATTTAAAAAAAAATVISNTADTTTDAAAAPSIVGPRDHAASVAEEIAQKIAEGSSSVKRAAGGGITAADSTPSSSPLPPSTFRAAALKSVTEHVKIRERRAAATTTTTTTSPGRAPAGIDAVRVPNLWLAVAHSSSVKSGEVKKVEVDGVPIALWRTTAGDVSAVSDVCIHRGASLSRGWISSDRLVCPYHGFEFEENGRLAHMPGAGPPTGSAAAIAAAEKAAARARSSTPSSSCGGRKAPTYPVQEVGGWIYIFPDETRPGSVEQHYEPLVIPEARSPQFRAIEGSMDIKGGVDACVENMLDMLHISFVHSFGNMQDPTPFEVSYAEGFDDVGSEVLATSQVTFRYRSGSKSFSKVVGGSTEVVVKNEFHLPYRAVIRVFFGKNSLKTIEATAVPRSDGETTLHWKLYRNFAITHPQDQGPINKAGDFLFRQMMELTLREDKEIIENIYPEYQRGFMNARYDKQVLQYRKAMTNFQAAAADRANTQVETSLQMELLKRISRSQRGLASTRNDRAAILDLIERLERGQASNANPDANKTDAAASPGSRGSSSGSGDKLAAEAAKAAKDANAAATAVEAMVEDESVEGQWHLEFVSNAEEGASGWDFTSSTDPEKTERTDALKEAGGEARLFDWNEKGRPLWADTAESIQIIDTKARTLINRAVYKGWSGFTTTVQLDAFIEPLQDQANRLIVGFHKAVVNVGGIKVTFPHLQRFSPPGWMETTYVNQGIRIARGNKGSIFVLTRTPVSLPYTSELFNDDGKK